MTLRDIQRLSIRPRKWEINCSAAMLYRMLGRKALFYMIAVSWDNKKQKKKEACAQGSYVLNQLCFIYALASSLALV
jgi:hypothetical protein